MREEAHGLDGGATAAGKIIEQENELFPFSFGTDGGGSGLGLDLLPQSEHNSLALYFVYQRTINTKFQG